MQASSGPLAGAQREAEAAAATLIERKFKEPANLEVRAAWRLRSLEFALGVHNFTAANPHLAADR